MFSSGFTSLSVWLLFPVLITFFVFVHGFWFYFIQHKDSHSPALFDLFLSSDTSTCSTMVFPPLGNSDHVVVSLTFYQIHNRMPCFLAYLMTILVLIGIVFGIIWEIFCGRISLNLVLLLLLVNFVSWFGLELMYISLIENIKSSLIHLYGFQLLVLLP